MSVTKTRPLLALLVVLAPGALFAQAMPAPGALVDVGGHRLHIDCIGTGTPALILDAGAGGWSIHVRRLQELTATFTRTCSYDRAGLGWSDPRPGASTAGRAADDLLTLLTEAGIVPPFVLLGHSYGGYVSRLLASRRPAAVAGVVLVESGHERQWERLPDEAWEAVESSRAQLEGAAEAARAGILTAADLPADPFADDPELRAAWESASLTPKPYLGLVAELEGLPATTQEVAAATSLDSIPLVVVTAGNSFAAFADLGIPVEEANAVWMELQTELVELSSDAVHVLRPGATHDIVRSDPAIVSAAARYLVERARLNRARTRPTGGRPEPRRRGP